MWHDGGDGSMRDERGVALRYGMGAYVRAHPTLGNVVAGAPGEVYWDGENSAAPLEGDTVLWFNKGRGTVVEGGGEVTWALLQALAAAQGALAKTQGGGGAAVDAAAVGREAAGDTLRSLATALGAAASALGK